MKLVSFALSVSLLLLALLLALVLWFWASAELIPLQEYITAPSDRASVPLKNESEARPAASPREAQRQRIPDLSAALPAIEDQAKPHADGFVAAALEVLVQDHATGRPVGGAEVFYMDPAANQKLRQLDAAESKRLMLDPIEMHVRYGKRLVSDSDGLVRIPDDSQEYAFVVARKGELIGMTGFEPDYSERDGVFKLILGPRVRLQAKVLDHDGRPIEGIQVQILGRWGTSKRRSIMGLGRTGINGIAESNHPLEAVLRRRPGPKTEPTETAIAVKFPGCTAVEVPIDLQAPPTEPVLLQLPKTGSLEVKVKAPDGGPWTPSYLALVQVEIAGEKQRHSLYRDKTGAYRMPYLALGKQCKISVSTEGTREEVEAAGPTEQGQQVVVEINAPASGRVIVTQTDSSGRLIPIRSTAWVKLGEQGNPPRTRGRLGGGRIVYHHVPLGRVFTISFSADASSKEQTVPGPRRHGEEVVVRFLIDTDTLTIVGRALDEKGQPHARCKIRLSCGFLSDTTYTNGDGKFGIVIRLRPNSPQTAPLTLQLLSHRDMPTGETYQIPAANLAQGELRLGDITLKKPVLILLAEVVRAGQAHPRQLSFSVRRLESYTVRGQARERWRTASDITRVERRDCYVEFRGTWVPGRYRLRVSGTDILPVQPLEFTPGTTDLKVHVVRGGRLTARIRVDASITPATLWVALEQIRGQRPDDAPSPFLIPGRGHSVQTRRKEPSTRDQLLNYSWSALWPGTYRLLIRPLGTAIPVRTIEPLEIVAGKPTNDDRLQEIDIRGTTQLVRITLLEPTGKPLMSRRTQPLLVRRGTDPLAFDSPAQDPEGRYLIAKTAAPLHVVVCAREYRVMEIGGITKDTTIRLRPPHRVRVTLKDGGPTLPKGKTLYLSMTWKGRPPEKSMVLSRHGPERLVSVLRGTVRHVAVERGEATLLVRQSGDYRPKARIRDASSRRFVRVVEFPESVQWSVLPLDDLQEFDLVVPQQLVDAALAR